MNVFRRLMTNPLKGNFLNARSALRGRAASVESTSAVPDTLRERHMIPSNSLSRWNIRENALLMPSVNECTALQETLSS